MNRRARIVAVAVAGLGLSAAGCGNKEDVVHEAHTEGIYLDVGPLDYQVQISRVLNPADVPDRDYFLGVPEGERELADDEAWFAVFVRVQNQTQEPHETAEEFEILDTQENVFRPLEIAHEANPIAYEARELEPGGILPSGDSVAGDGPTQGELLLFKLPISALQNRPLEFKIVSPESPDDEGVVEIDV